MTPRERAAAQVARLLTYGTVSSDMAFVAVVSTVDRDADDATTADTVRGALDALDVHHAQVLAELERLDEPTGPDERCASCGTARGEHGIAVHAFVGAR